MRNIQLISLAIFLLSIQAYLLANIFPAILAFLISVYILYIALEFDPKLEIRREIGKVLYEGKKSISRLKVKNLGDKEYRAKFFETLPPDFEAEKLEFDIGKSEEKEIEYWIIPVRGIYKLRGNIEVEDTRGIFRSNLRVNESEIEVLPSVDKLKEEARINARLKHASKSFFGSPVDFKSLREFQEGDDARRIDWKASARLGELILREFLMEWEGDIYIVLDVSKEMRKGKIDYALRLIYQLLNSLRGKRVGLVIYDELGIRKIVKATEEESKLLKELKISPIKGEQSLKIPEMRLSSVLRVFFRKTQFLPLSLIKEIPKKSFLIFISDLSNPDEVVKALIEIKKECRVVLISPNPVLFYRGRITKDTILELYEAYLRREKLLKQINKIVPTIDVGPNELIPEIGGSLR
ncbi:MAG: DUF58 domain-containing protein [Archaeoglobaceae archaeon]|nr:DUF58 domain-containing protein [Archaeoglobaceae archaeon]MDW8117372.1 DUF58 domain-containing protein [Archaeoglobaceae archaeon]